MEILYKSTRDDSKSVSASYAIIKGIAEDGGLYMPNQFPSLEISLEDLSKLDYKGVAYEVMKLFFSILRKMSFATVLRMLTIPNLIPKK